MNLNYSKNQINYWSVYLSRIPNWSQSWDLPRYQAHRGYWLPSNRQNSLESLSEAKKRGYQMAEFDVQLTKDGVPVLFHDFGLDQVLKKRVLISEVRYSDLKELCLAPTLLEVLTSKNRPVFLNIEIKSKNFLSSEFEERVVEVVKKARAQEQILFSSFNHWSLIKLKNMTPNIPRALLVTGESESWNKSYLQKMWLMPLVEPSLIHFNYAMIQPDMLAFFKNHGLKIAAWTVNEQPMAEHLLAMGVDSLISDALGPI